MTDSPIKDNRIIHDITFATRFKNFLDWIPKEWIHSQPHYLEEFEYLKWIAEELLNWQMKTCEDKDEINYFKNLGYDLQRRTTDSK